MTTGNGVPTVTHDGDDLHARDGSKHVRDIEELVAKLRLVTMELASMQLGAHGEAGELRG